MYWWFTIGQYYMLVNTEKKEYINPHNAGSGLKMWEIAASNLPRLLTYLVGHSTGGGGGDPRGHLARKEWGRWANNRVIITGDYDEDTKKGEKNLYERVQDDPEWKEISDKVIPPYNAFIEREEWKITESW